MNYQCSVLLYYLGPLGRMVQSVPKELPHCNNLTVYVIIMYYKGIYLSIYLFKNQVVQISTIPITIWCEKYLLPGDIKNFKQQVCFLELLDFIFTIIIVDSMCKMGILKKLISPKKNT